MRLFRHLILAVITIYLAWVGMLATHELGHVLHAWVAGGRVVQISFPPLGFSQTFVDPNPRPLFVVWGGPIWGAFLPMLCLLIIRMCNRRAPTIISFFAGFCLISNGAYIGLGWLKQSGDGHDMVRLGTPFGVMVVFGVVCSVGGLWCWHRIPSSWWRGNTESLK